MVGWVVLRFGRARGWFRDGKIVAVFCKKSVVVRYIRDKIKFSQN